MSSTEICVLANNSIRKAALQFNTPCVTTITGAEALIEAIATKMVQSHVTVRSLQEIHQASRSQPSVKSFAQDRPVS